MICNDSYYPSHALKVDSTSKSNTKRKKGRFLISRLKKKDRVFFRWRVWVDLRAFRLVTKNLRATLFRGHIEENHVLRFLSLDEKKRSEYTQSAKDFF